MLPLLPNNIPPPGGPVAPLTISKQDVSAACIYSVAKLGPSPRSPRDVTNVYAYLLSPSSSLFRNRTEAAGSDIDPPSQPPPPPPPTNDPSSYYLGESAYSAFRQRILDLEARILYSLSFDTHVALPHPLVVTYLQALDFLGKPREAISRLAVGYLNTALLSPQMLYLTHQPSTLAVAAIYNAARDAGARMPDCAWWEVFDVDREELGFLVVGMRSVDGWARKMRGDVPGWRGGMLTREMIEEEMGSRGLRADNGSGGGMDEEQEMMRQMDARAAEVETQ